MVKICHKDNISLTSTLLTQNKNKQTTQALKTEDSTSLQDIPLKRKFRLQVVNTAVTVKLIVVAGYFKKGTLCALYLFYYQSSVYFFDCGRDSS